MSTKQMNCNVDTRIHELKLTSIMMEVNVFNNNPDVKNNRLVVTDISTNAVVYDDVLDGNKGYFNVENLTPDTKYDFLFTHYFDNACGEVSYVKPMKTDRVKVASKLKSARLYHQEGTLEYFVHVEWDMVEVSRVNSHHISCFVDEHEIIMGQVKLNNTSLKEYYLKYRSLLGNRIPTKLMLVTQFDDNTCAGEILDILG